MSENYNTQESAQQENSEEKPLLMRTANILGFNVPHWVLIALVLIFIYYLYHRGVFKNMFNSAQNVSIADKSVLTQQTGVTDGAQTPEVVRRLFNKYN